MKNTTNLLLSLLAVLLVSACGGSNEVRVTEGTQPDSVIGSSNAYAGRSASIVHVNHSSRLATIRNGQMFDAGDFLIAKDREGRQTGVLKALPKRPIGLRTADVLEGEPDINNFVTRASAAEASRLEQIYRDPEE